MADSSSDASPISTGTRGMKRQVSRRMWRLFVIVFLNALVNMSLFFDLEASFIMSLTTCPEPTPSPGCPLGSFLQDDRCLPQPRTSPNWSYSIHCASKHKVLNTERRIQANLGTLGHIGTVFAIIVLGPLADAWGRKEVMLIALSGFCVKSAAQWHASRLVGQESWQRTLLMLGMLLSNMANNFGSASRAMAADLSSRDAEHRSAAFGAMSLVMAGAIATGFTGGFFILRLNLSSYEYVWLGSMIAGLGIVALAYAILQNPVQEGREVTAGKSVKDVEESSGASSSSEDEVSVGLFGGIRQTCSVYKGFMRDPMLREVVLFAGFLAFANPADHLGRLVLLGHLHYSQAIASVFGIVTPVFAGVGNSLLAGLVRKFETFGTFGISLVIHAIGMALVGLCLPFMGAAPVLFWLGMTLAGISKGIDQPLLHAMASIRVPDHVQARVFSLMMLVEVVGSLAGLQLFQRRLYNADWEGWKAGSAFFTAAGFKLLACLWLLRLSRLARRHRMDSDESSSEAE